MRRTILAALVLLLAAGLQPGTAQAQTAAPKYGYSNPFWDLLVGKEDPRLATPGAFLGAAGLATSYFLTQKHGNPGVQTMSGATAWGVTTAGCVVLYPILGTIVLNRPLTPREAYVGMANCIVPFIGGWITEAVLPHDAWTDGLPAKPVRVAHRKQ